jgi:Mg-chelatase subunit ChlD
MQMDISIFSFGKPIILLLIIPVAAYIIYLSQKMPGLSQKIPGFLSIRRKAVIVIRLICITLLILAISGVSIRRVSDTTTTIFAIDSSESISEAKNQIENFIKDAIKNKKHDEKVGVVVFGADTSVEILPSANPIFDSIQAKVNGSYTNIAQGLRFASSLIPSGDRKRIVLVTDGVENIGDSLKTSRLLNNQRIVVDVFPLGNQEENEVQVKEVILPEVLHKGEKFEVIVKVDSTVKTGSSLKLYGDKQLVAQRRVEIDKGINTFIFSGTAEKGGLITYTAVIEPDEDTIIKNNSMSALSHVNDILEILVIQNDSHSASELIKILEKDVRIKNIKPENAPVTLEDIVKYQAFILSDISADDLDERFLNNLEICIKYQGKGLLVTGGENSYALGGYYDTPLETVLPVNMDITPREEMPDLGLVLVIDKSGSMASGQYGVSKVELAKEAAIRSTEVLTSRDMIGVIAFDDAVQWVVKTQKLDDLASVQNAIGTIRAGGGTQILPPLEEAYLSLKDADTKLKHIILLTDGQAERSGYEILIDKINRAGITLSTVAVGSSADISLLNALAIGGNGRFYMTDEFTDIPKIFAKETFLAGKTYLNNRTFTPNIKSWSEILKGIDAVPSLDGYVGTTAKNAAQVIFASDSDQPVFTVWQYGLGRTAAWTSDVKGAWTGNWLKWEQSPAFWKNTLSWLIQRHTVEDYSISGGLALESEDARGGAPGGIISTDGTAGVRMGGGIGVIELELPLFNEDKYSDDDKRVDENEKTEENDILHDNESKTVTETVTVTETITETVVEGLIVSPSGKEQFIILQPVSPVKYKGFFKADETGIYIASINIKQRMGKNEIEKSEKGGTGKNQIESEKDGTENNNAEREKNDTERSEEGKGQGAEEQVEKGQIENDSKEDEWKIIRNINTGISIPYSPEYNISRVDKTGFLRQLANEGGGRILESEAEVFKEDPPPVSGSKDITHILIAIAIILFVTEIGIRRLNLKWDKVFSKVAEIVEIAEKNSRKTIFTIKNLAKTGWAKKDGVTISAKPDITAKSYKTVRHDKEQTVKSDQTVKFEQRQPEKQNIIKESWHTKSESKPETKPEARPEVESEYTSNISILLDKKRKRDGKR